MPLEATRAEIKRFLASANPEVLVLKGRWGSGKTHHWHDELKKAASSNGIALPKYAYVSMFGVDSLDELKYLIFHNVVAVGPGMTDPAAQAVGHTSNIVRSFIDGIKKVPQVRDWVPAFRSLTFSTVSKTIVCIDDLERKGVETSFRDILGVVATLREQRQCKIVIILNDGAIATADDADEYSTYREKVVDVEISFKPTAAECAEIAFPSQDEVSRRLRANATTLGIDNIRVLFRIRRLAEILGTLLSEFDPDVYRQSLHSLVLLTWSRLGHGEDVPAIEYIRAKNGEFDGMIDREETEQESKWSRLLLVYDYQRNDELDLEVDKLVVAGFADTKLLKAAGKKLHDEILGRRVDNRFANAWERYHDSFDHDEEELIDEIFAAAFAAMARLGATGVDQTVRLLKDLGQNDKASQLIDEFVRVNEKQRAAFDLEDHPFGGEVRDPELRERLGAELRKAPGHGSIEEVLGGIAGDRHWSSGDEEVLAAASVEEFHTLFKNTKGKELRLFVRRILEFGEPQGATERQRLIAERGLEALRKIGGESALNRRRVEKFGVQMPVE